MSSLNIFRSSPIELLKPATWRLWLSSWTSQLRTARLNRNDPAFLPLCAALALIVMAVLQFMLPDPPLDTVAPRSSRAVVSFNAELPSDYPAIMKAPIFAPDRRPDPNDATVHTTQDIALIAVATAPDRSVALFKGADGKTQRVLTGDLIDGWRLISVDAQKAVLEKNGQQRLMPLTAGQAIPVTAAAQSDTTQSGQPSSDDDSDDQ